MGKQADHLALARPSIREAADAALPPVSVPRDTALPYLPQLQNEGTEEAPPGDDETGRLASATRILAPLGITRRDLERLVAANRARATGELDLV